MRTGTALLTLAVFAVPLLVSACSSADASTRDSAQAGENVLINLYDHVTGPNSGDAIPDWGYSAFIRYRGTTILFDGGTSAVILEHNARTLGVDLREVDMAVVSHNHGDHTVGIDYLVQVNPSVAIYVPAGSGLGGSGDRYRKGYRWQIDELHAVGRATEIVPGATLIPTSSPHTGQFSRYPPHEQEPQLYQLPELSLALEKDDGSIFLVTGCSHSGVNAIVRAAQEATGADIDLVTGGFHLGPYSRDYVLEVARAMKEDLGVAHAGATHCTGDQAIAIFGDTFGEGYVFAGLGARIAF
jgi:7,8-dihydropterin-6-yl-methyl-4-(beta-D-ribofuranosyl)aminobenzene 5'-phosphate synthase